MNKFEKLFANVPEIELENADKEDKAFFIEMQEKEYNGNLSLRVPVECHKKLVEDAKKNHTSLNQWCLYKLASN